MRSFRVIQGLRMLRNLKHMGSVLAGVLLAVLLLTGIKNEYARLLPVSSYGMQAAIKMVRTLTTGDGKKKGGRKNDRISKGRGEQSG